MMDEFYKRPVMLTVHCSTQDQGWDYGGKNTHKLTPSLRVDRRLDTTLLESDRICIQATGNAERAIRGEVSAGMIAIFY